MASRRTKARLAIAAELLASAQSVHWGYELSRNSGVSAGSMYPFLAELLEQGYLTDGWEDHAGVAGRPPRRFYRLTPEGETYILQFLAAAPAPIRAGKRTVSSVRPKVVES